MVSNPNFEKTVNRNARGEFDRKNRTGMPTAGRSGQQQWWQRVAEDDEPEENIVWNRKDCYGREQAEMDESVAGYDSHTLAVAMESGKAMGAWGSRVRSKEEDVYFDDEGRFDTDYEMSEEEEDKARIGGMYRIDHERNRREVPYRIPNEN